MGWGDGKVIDFANGRVEYSGHESFVGGPKSLNIIERSSISALAWKSGSFNISSANIHPTDHMSTAVE